MEPPAPEKILKNKGQTEANCFEGALNVFRPFPDETANNYAKYDFEIGISIFQPHDYSLHTSWQGKGHVNTHGSKISIFKGISFLQLPLDMYRI